jgi:hypothetical protein
MVARTRQDKDDPMKIERSKITEQQTEQQEQSWLDI